MPGPPGKQLGLNHWPWASGLGPTEMPPFSGVINKEGVLKQTEGTQLGQAGGGPVGGGAGSTHEWRS